MTYGKPCSHERTDNDAPPSYVGTELRDLVRTARELATAQAVVDALTAVCDGAESEGLRYVPVDTIRAALNERRA